MSLQIYIQRKIRRFLGLADIDSKLNQILGADLSSTVKLAANLSSAEFIAEHMVSAKPLDSTFEVLDFAMAKVPRDMSGMYCEFGVYRAQTLNHIARNTKGAVYGFDSFQGLPEKWRDGFAKGEFSLAGGALPECESNVELVPGWFNETLPPFLASHSGPVAFLHVDCDLYSSTKTVLDLMGGRLTVGSVIVFDEYFNYPGWKLHEHLAFQEFIKESGKRFEYLCYNRYHEQVAVQIL